jgi:hypothetical protein
MEAAERRRGCNGERGSPTVNDQDAKLGGPERSGCPEGSRAVGEAGVNKEERRFRSHLPPWMAAYRGKASKGRASQGKDLWQKHRGWQG